MSHEPGEGKDADADDAADADRGELPESETLGKVTYVALLLDLLNVVDREFSHDRARLVFPHVRTSVLKPRADCGPGH